MTDPYQIDPVSSSDALRQRTTSTARSSKSSASSHQQTDNSNAAQNNNNNNDLPSRYAAGLRRSNLLRASPSQTGVVHKLKLPLLFAVLPFAWQAWLLRQTTSSRSRSPWSSCWQWWLRGLLPCWQPRLLIVVGSYLYKFVDDDKQLNHNKTNDGPKGRPIPLEAMLDIQILSSSSSSGLGDARAAVQWLPRPNMNVNRYTDHPGQSLPSSSSSHNNSNDWQILVISTLRKRYYFAVDATHAPAWVTTLVQGRTEATKRQMGHAPPDSYPPQWHYYDRLAAALVQRQARVAQRLEQQQRRELELTQMAVGGGGGGMMMMDSSSAGMMNHPYRDDDHGGYDDRYFDNTTKARGVYC
mmetsp:Transcript_18624/g.50911  ORF Transcript_18624/g.50911 Transcript_18624/m.50911 type:complete len:355 (+) Transcript_18624:94-1158(+)